MTSNQIGRQAVVVGAGMAGLPVARVLADYFEQVAVLERDILPGDAYHRSGTPQSKHVHGLLSGGQRALSDLFPDFEQDLVRAGAVPLRVGLDLRAEMPGYDPFPQRDLGWTVYSMSRPLIEFAARQAVAQYGNITLYPRCRARSFEASPDGMAVTAVRFENGNGSIERLGADLCIDASGRGNLCLGLLQSIGQAPPAETVIGVDIGYATAIFAIPQDLSVDWKGVRTFAHAPQSSRAGLMLPLEGNCWMLTLGGRCADKPPGDRDGFLAYAQQLRTPTIYNAVRGARQLGEAVRFGFPASVWRHFEQVEPFPRGLLPIGDVLCRFNPIYGQGMSVAAQQALLLQQLLRRQVQEPEPLAALAPAFFAGAYGLIETPWAQAAVADFSFPETKGERPPDLARSFEFRAALTRLAASDPDVHKLMVEVQLLVKPPSVLRDLDLLERVRAIASTV
jgi:2-polyprenyl-6-methoxyphenol hydroxylase-like FAD-dependent oxidoreductase